MGNYDDVKKMYEKFGFVADGIVPPHLVGSEVATFRLEALQEELDELAEGYAENNLPKIADSLVDLVVFALGTAALHHLPWEDLFDEVMRANTSKVAQVTDIKKRNGAGSIDLIKPAGWKSPDIESILDAASKERRVEC